MLCLEEMIVLLLASTLFEAIGGTDDFLFEIEAWRGEWVHVARFAHTRCPSGGGAGQKGGFFCLRKAEILRFGADCVLWRFVDGAFDHIIVGFARVRELHIIFAEVGRGRWSWGELASLRR